MTFPYFQRQVEWCQSYFIKMSLKAYIVYRKLCYYTTQGYLMCNKFCVERVWPNVTTETLYVKSLPTP